MAAVQKLGRLEAIRLTGEPDQGSRPPRRILVVHESESVTTELRSVLREAMGRRVAVDCEHRLDDALRRIERRAPDVVVLSLTLPDSVGLSTYQRTRDKAGSPAAVLVLADHEDDEAALEAVREGASGFVVPAGLTPSAWVQLVRSAVVRERANAGLKSRAERLGLALRATNDGVWDWDLRRGVVVYSARWNSMLGYPEAEVQGTPEVWFDQVHPEDLPELRRLLQAHVAGGPRLLECEYRMLGAAGEYLWIHNRAVVVRDLDGTVTRLTGVHTDITARKRAEAQLVHDALHDGLTGLPNRALFVERMERALAGLRRGETSHFSVLYFDLDRFKTVNDRYGHAVGDGLLAEVGVRLRRALRPGDTVARMSGDEFAILVTSAGDLSAASHVAERVLEILARPVRVGENELVVTASMGVALSATGYLRPEPMLHDADIAMYRAKSAGRAQYQIFDSAMHESALALLRTEGELRRAVEEMTFVMHYQPIVTLEGGGIVGFEGMVRWQHPVDGLVPPSEFLQVAESSGLIVPIGWWAIEECCRQLAEWRRRFPDRRSLWVSVNVSGRLFLEDGMVDRVGELLEEYGLEPESLRLEVTEAAVLEAGSRLVGKLERLQRLGVGISVDDFGTGYSSLSHLQRLQYDILKIDASCIGAIDDTGDTEDAAAAVEAILKLGSTFGIGVIAEGVETDAQVSRLRRLRCPHGQGFWFTRPVPAEEAGNLIGTSPAEWAGVG